MRFSWVFTLLLGCGSASGARTEGGGLRPIVSTDAGTAAADLVSPEPTVASPTASIEELVPAGGTPIRAAGVTMTLFSRATVSGTVAPDRRSVVLVPVGRGAPRLRTATATVDLDAEGEVVSGSFSPDSRYLALEEAGGTVRIYAVPSGRVVASISGRMPRFDQRSMLLVAGSGCVVHVVDPRRPDARRQLGGSCDGRLQSFVPNGRIGLITKPAGFRLGLFPAYTRADWLELDDPGDVVTVLGGARGRPFFMPQLSPTGTHLIYFDARFGLHLVDLASRAVVDLWPEDALRDPTFSPSGDRVLFEAGGSDHEPHDLWLYELGQPKPRSVMREVVQESWAFLPNERRVVGHGGRDGFVVLETEGTRRWIVNRRGEEWEGVVLVPSDDEHVLVGRERGGTRDLWLVDLEPDAQ